MSNIILHVIADFAAYIKGEIIRDADAIASVLETNPHHVVAVAAPISSTTTESTTESEPTSAPATDESAE